MTRTDLSGQAAAFLKSLPAKQARQIAEHVLTLSGQSGTAGVDAPKSHELSGYGFFRQTKSGDYRIVYHQAEETIFVTLIGKRNDDDIEKQLQRLLK